MQETSNKTDKTSFIFYKSFYESVKNLPKENQLEVYNLIFEYCFETTQKTTQNNSAIALAIFKLIKPNIDANNKRYFANIENGKKGGAPVGNNNAKKNKKQPKNNPKTTQKQPKTTFNEDVDVDVDVDVDEDVDEDVDVDVDEDVDEDVDVDVDVDVECIKNKNILIKKEYQKFYNPKNIEQKKEYAEFVSLTESEANRLIGEFGDFYFKKAIEFLSIWKLEKHSQKDFKAIKGDDNLKLRKWVFAKVREDFKKLDFNAYTDHEQKLKKLTNPESVKMMQELLESGYCKDKDILLSIDDKKLKLWYDEFLELKAKGEYK